MHRAEIRNLYCSPNIIGAIKSRRMSGGTRSMHERETRDAYNIVVLKFNRRDHLRDLGVDGR